MKIDDIPPFLDPIQVDGSFREHEMKRVEYIRAFIKKHQPATIDLETMDVVTLMMFGDLLWNESESSDPLFCGMFENVKVKYIRCNT